jgi:hypothetical protein
MGACLFTLSKEPDISVHVPMLVMRPDASRNVAMLVRKPNACVNVAMLVRMPDACVNVAMLVRRPDACVNVAMLVRRPDACVNVAMLVRKPQKRGSSHGCLTSFSSSTSATVRRSWCGSVIVKGSARRRSRSRSVRSGKLGPEKAQRQRNLLPNSSFNKKKTEIGVVWEKSIDVSEGAKKSL